MKKILFVSRVEGSPYVLIWRVPKFMLKKSGTIGPALGTKVPFGKPRLIGKIYMAITRPQIVYNDPGLAVPAKLKLK